MVLSAAVSLTFHQEHDSDDPDTHLQATSAELGVLLALLQQKSECVEGWLVPRSMWVLHVTRCATLGCGVRVIAKPAVLLLFAFARTSKGRLDCAKLGAVGLLVGWCATQLMRLHAVQAPSDMYVMRRPIQAVVGDMLLYKTHVCGVCCVCHTVCASWCGGGMVRCRRVGPPTANTVPLLECVVGTLWQLSFSVDAALKLVEASGLEVLADVLAMSKSVAPLATCQTLACQALWVLCAVHKTQDLAHVRPALARLGVVKSCLRLASDQSKKTDLRMAATRVLLMCEHHASCCLAERRRRRSDLYA